MPRKIPGRIRDGVLEKEREENVRAIGVTRLDLFVPILTLGTWGEARQKNLRSSGGDSKLAKGALHLNPDSLQVSV